MCYIANYIGSSKLTLNNIRQSKMFISEKLDVVWIVSFNNFSIRNENKLRLDKTKLKYFLNKF